MALQVDCGDHDGPATGIAQFTREYLTGRLAGMDLAATLHGGHPASSRSNSRAARCPAGTDVPVRVRRRRRIVQPRVRKAHPIAIGPARTRPRRCAA